MATQFVISAFDGTKAGYPEQAVSESIIYSFMEMDSLDLNLCAYLANQYRITPILWAGNEDNDSFPSNRDDMAFCITAYDSNTSFHTPLCWWNVVTREWDFTRNTTVNSQMSRNG